MYKFLNSSERITKQLFSARLSWTGSRVWTVAPGKAIQKYSQLLTFFMIFFISLTITPQQFVQVVRQPWAVLAGLVLNFLFMPLVCWVLARTMISDQSLAVELFLSA